MKVRRYRVLVTALFLTALAGALAGCAAEQAEETPSAVQLEAPGNFTLTERELSWDAVPHAAMYAIEFSEEHYTTRQTYYVLPELTGEVTVRVMAYGDGIDYLYSEWAEYRYVNIVEEPTAALKYTVLPDGSGVEVTRLYSDVNRGLEGRIYIPDYYNGMPVTRIADLAFSLDTLWYDTATGEGCNTVTMGVRLPKYLKEIGEDAFACCTALTEIEIPDSVESIGAWAFNRCISLKQVDLPAGLQRIEGAVFNSIAVEEIEIPETVTYIGRSAFIGCVNLTEIVIPDSVTEIGDDAFNSCERLMTITMSDHIETMGSEIFEGTAWYDAQPDGFVMLGEILYRLKGDRIREVTSLPEGTKYLAGGVFYKCQQLERVDLSGELGLTWLGEDMFYMCTGMKEIVFPADLTELLPGTIAQCGRLEEIVIPGSVKRIADFAMERAGMAALRGTGTFRGIFYGGTQEEWDAIEIEESAEVLDEEKYVRYYYSESEPETNAEGTAYAGNYWRYVDGVPTAWIWKDER